MEFEWDGEHRFLTFGYSRMSQLLVVVHTVHQENFALTDRLSLDILA
jgi:uncharacterized DUF497 family protein